MTRKAKILRTKAEQQNQGSRNVDERERETKNRGSGQHVLALTHIPVGLRSFQKIINILLREI